MERQSKRVHFSVPRLRRKEILMESTSHRIQRLYIDELFGPGSTPIDITFKLKARVTILHGRNGSGKTITLQLLHALREGRYEALLDYPFKRLELTLEDGSGLRIERSADTTETQAKAPPSKKNRPRARAPGLSAGLSPQLKFILMRTDQPEETIKWSGVSHAALAQRLEASPELPEWLVRVGPDQWLDHQMSEVISSHGALRRYPEFFGEYSPTGVAEDPRLRTFRNQLPAFKLVTIERLQAKDDESARFPGRATERKLMVQRISADIRALVVTADREYRQTSTKLDGSLASRLFLKPRKEEMLTLEALKERYHRLDKQEEQLLSLGLLTETSKAVDEAEMTENQKNILHTILLDREAKLRPFEVVVKKSQRLIESINRKLAPKTVKLNVDLGYQVFTASGQPLPLEKLSSGEQHELVLQHELLFDVPEGSLILIDEPELSLHVSWQEDFLPDILAIAELSRLDFLLATHSPYIVGERVDLLVRQGEPLL